MNKTLILALSVGTVLGWVLPTDWFHQHTETTYTAYDIAYAAGRHDVVKQWYEKCRRGTVGDMPDPPGTKALATYCGTEMKNLIGVDNIWPGEFP